MHFLSQEKPFRKFTRLRRCFYILFSHHFYSSMHTDNSMLSCGRILFSNHLIYTCMKLTTLRVRYCFTISVKVNKIAILPINFTSHHHMCILNKFGLLKPLSSFMQKKFDLPPGKVYIRWHRNIHKH